MWMMEIRPAQGVFEVGWITYSPSLQRTRAATEAVYLIGDYGFVARLPALRMEVQQPQRAVEARGAALRLQVRGPVPPAQVVKGENRDTAWYSIIDSEWPARKAAFERWLAPENFDAQGQQKASLSSLNAA